MIRYQLICPACRQAFRANSEIQVIKTLDRHEQREHFGPVPPVALLHCAEPGCEAGIKAHAWGKIKAQSAGWFFSKAALSWCPEHNPPWVEQWRRNKQQQL